MQILKYRVPPSPVLWHFQSIRSHPDIHDPFVAESVWEKIRDRVSFSAYRKQVFTTIISETVSSNANIYIMKHKYVCNITLGTHESILLIKCNKRSSSDQSEEGMATTCIRINLLPNVNKGSHL